MKESKTQTLWRFLICSGVFLALLACGVTYADDGTTTAQAATVSRHQPVVAPVPSGIDPSSPSVSNATPSNDVQVSTPVPVANNFSIK